MQNEIYRSNDILKELNKANKILINVHRSPDPDSIGSALAFYEYLKSEGKIVKVIGPSDLAEENLFLPNVNVIEKIYFKNFKFSDWDVFLILDSGSWEMVTGGIKIERPKLKVLLIDHHITSDRFGDLNIIDENVSSTSELVYSLFKEWKINITPTMSQNLLAGIICDTGIFQYPNVNSQTLSAAKELMDKGANKNEIVEKVYRNYPFNQLKLWGKIIELMKFDEENRFVYSAIPFVTYKDFNKPESVKETAASMFSVSIKGADFGMIMIEEEPNKLSVSLRAKNNFDVSEIAKSLGGGGHKLASGVTIKDQEFNKAVDIVLKEATKYAQKNKKNY